MSAKPNSLDSWQKVSNQDQIGTADDKKMKNESGMISNGKILSEIPNKKPNENNYFAKNFDECMKRIQLLEKEHELVEKSGSKIEFFYLRQESENLIAPTDNNKLESFREVSISEEVQEIKVDPESRMNREENENFVTNQCQGIELKLGKESEENFNEKDVENCRELRLEEMTDNNNHSVTSRENDKETVLQWQSNLKEDLEKNEEDNIKEKKEGQEAKETSCRITGATLKNSNENQKIEEKETETIRHYFSKLVKPKRSLIDVELPDPDQVRNIRAKFQENLESTLKKRLNSGEFGGSLQNINAGKGEQIPRPLSVQYNTEDVIKEMYDKTTLAKEKRIKGNEKESTESVKDSEKEFSNDLMEKELSEKHDKVIKILKDSRNSKLLSSKWTDSGSVSSGVSSDLSSYDTDLESYSKEGLEPEPNENITSDDDLLDEMKDKHYVQNEILDKIRSFGTSVTYYGGEMITCAVGPILSPTTQAIMEEIGGKYGEESNFPSSFADFYRKHVETNFDPRKKKVGRVRSFGQSDLFHKPNVLNNSEIEMYKDDLETEIGIRKPKGIRKTNLKVNSSEKFRSVENRLAKMENHKGEENSMGTHQIIPNCSDENEGKSFEGAKIAVFHDFPRDRKNKVLGPVKEIDSDSNIPKSDFNKGEKSIQSGKREEIDSIQEPSEKPLFTRCQSVPSDTRYKSGEEKSEFLGSQPKSILFGYDKKMFNGRKIPDIQFESFEVCESESEKIRKIQERKIVGKKSISDEEIAVPEKMDSPSVDSREENNNVTNDESVKSNMNDENQSIIEIDTGFRIGREKKNFFFNSVETNNNEETDRTKCTNMKKYEENNNFRWPIETGVLADIEKLNRNS